ncbi:MAG: hypothetical protein Q4C00_00595 [Bacillota bacterium]|nr:hypothetical protein [Bacillota bacterium]
MEVLDLVLKGLSLDEVTPEAENAVTAVGQYIKEYCCLGEIPCELYPLWAEMALDVIAKERQGAGPDTRSLTSVSMGDVSYGFGAEPMVDAPTLLADYRHRLNKVRRGLFR